MSSAKWQRHSTFLSVRWRTWMGRALSSSGPAVGCRPPAAGQGGASTGRPVVAPHRKKAGFSAGDMATPGQLPGSARNAGCFLSLSGVNAYPGPIQQPFPELVIGGHTPGAYRRSVEQGNGWYGFGLDLAHIAASLEGLRAAADQYARPSALGSLEISVTPSGPIDPDTARQYADLGVHRLILGPPRGLDVGGMHAFVSSVGETLVGRV
jgi:Luciferase-like monooxygenase